MTTIYIMQSYLPMLLPLQLLPLLLIASAT
jgi:hypothetical protein